MPKTPTYVRAIVRIAYKDATGHHNVGEPVMLPAGTGREVENLRRLVEYKVVDAVVPSDSSFVPVPDPGPSPEVNTNPSPPPPIPFLGPSPETDEERPIPRPPTPTPPTPTPPTPTPPTPPIDPPGRR